jgi:Transglutaminase-like enzymes, putative cysteine proteases
MSRHSAFGAIGLGALCALAAAAQDSPAAIRLGDSTTSNWRFGVVISTPEGAASGLVATLPVPMDWPEQQVKLIDEQKSPGVRVSYRTLESGVKQMVVNISKLAASEEASAIVTFAVTKRRILEPADTSGLVLPAKPGRDLSKFLAPSPYIESTDERIKSLAAEITAGKSAGWEQTATIFDWVRANVKYKFAEQIKSAVAAVQDGEGDCEELSSLVIALCRASKIPARAVWVPGHTYPEFFLVDAAGQGHWYPCQAAGESRQFGSMIEDRPILQKGDNFRVPEERQPQRYVQQRLSAKNAVGSPRAKFVMEKAE